MPVPMSLIDITICPAACWRAAAMLRPSRRSGLGCGPGPQPKRPIHARRDLCSLLLRQSARGLHRRSGGGLSPLHPGSRMAADQVFADRAVSGTSRYRVAYQQMIADAEHRVFDVVVCEALDRLGRKLSDVADFHDRLQFLGIPLHAVKMGEVTTLPVGLLGT